jgi:indole-3-glycerol phosphate synthase
VSGFLQHMQAASRARAAQAAAREPLPALRHRAFDTPPPLPLRNGRAFELIAEYKRRSPALGTLEGEAADPARRAVAYAAGGAAAVSVLTEPQHFDGRLEHLATCAGALRPLGVPAMRKDFLVDPYQLCEARAAGASGALLIVRLLDDAMLAEMLDCAREFRLFVLLEAFDEGDIDRAAAALGREAARRPDGDVLLGVNCRDLDSLAVEHTRLAALEPRLPRGCARVAESGLATPADCAAAAQAGYGMALVGGALMSAANPEDAVRRMLAAGRAAA